MLSIPQDFQRALKRSRLYGFFLECAYVHRAGYLSWLLATVRPEARERRIAQALAKLRAQRVEVLAAAREARLAKVHRPAIVPSDPGYADERQSA